MVSSRLSFSSVVAIGAQAFTVRLLVILASLAMAVAMPFAVVAQSSPYADGEEVAGGDYGDGLTYATYAAVSDDMVYQYATGTDGKAYYTTYDGSEWADWQGWAYQPGDVSYDPAPVDYDGDPHAFYTGTGGELYHITWDDAGESSWEDVAGDYAFAAAPAASYAHDAIQLYGYADDGYIYHKAYTEEDGWTEWVAVNDEASTGKAGTEPYAVAWGDYDNVFWTTEDGATYWNRYADDGTWSGPVVIEGDYTFDYAPYAVGYEPEESLYAYATTSDGAPAYNAFDGEGWSGWTAWEPEWQGKGQPTAYAWDDMQHVVYTSTDGEAYYVSYADGAYADEWVDLGPNYGWDAQQYAYDDAMYLTYTGEDGKAYYRAYDGPVVEPSPSSRY